MPDSIFGPGRCELLCQACAARTPPPPTAEEMRKAEEATIAAEEAAHREAWEREAIEAAKEPRGCDCCNAPLPASRVGICRDCELAAYPDTPDFDSDAIPW